MKKTVLLLGGLILFFHCGCSMKNVKRYSSVIGVKEEKLAYYKELHANPWPEVLEQLKESHFTNYSIHLKQMDDGKYYLFSYFEYTGDDFEADAQKIADNPITQKWWKETDPCQFALKNRKKGEWWASMEEVFYNE